MRTSELSAWPAAWQAPGVYFWEFIVAKLCSFSKLTSLGHLILARNS
jgi:hypothetical protein